MGAIYETKTDYGKKKESQQGKKGAKW